MPRACCNRIRVPVPTTAPLQVLQSLLQHARLRLLTRASTPPPPRASARRQALRATSAAQDAARARVVRRRRHRRGAAGGRGLCAHTRPSCAARPAIRSCAARHDAREDDTRARAPSLRRPQIPRRHLKGTSPACAACARSDRCCPTRRHQLVGKATSACASTPAHRGCCRAATACRTQLQRPHRAPVLPAAHLRRGRARAARHRPGTQQRALRRARRASQEMR